MFHHVKRKSYDFSIRCYFYVLSYINQLLVDKIYCKNFLWRK
nr:MAG TPA: hypothetical protein [Caudoviricetes sp.]